MIGISWFFGFDIKPKKRVELLKKYGFECVCTRNSRRYNKQNGSFKKQIKLFKKNGLKLSSLHMDYTNKDLPFFWTDSKIGDKLEKNIIKDIKHSSKHGFTCLVTHIKGKWSTIGKRRLLRILEVCEKYNVDLAIENLCNNERVFIKTLRTVKHKNLKFCYDTGHHNIGMKDIDLLDEFGDKLVALHLHSNMGDFDSHTLRKFGNIDWDAIAQKLAKLPDVYLDYELLFYVMPSGYTVEQALEECKKEAEHLSKRIEFYRKKVKNNER